MAIVINPHAAKFVAGLNAKWPAYGTFTVNPGKKYDKIVVATKPDDSVRVYAFVDQDGNVYKANGWAAPAKGVRYASVEAALQHADRFGAFLYTEYVKKISQQ